MAKTYPSISCCKDCKFYFPSDGRTNEVFCTYQGFTPIPTDVNTICAPFCKLDDAIDPAPIREIFNKYYADEKKFYGRTCYQVLTEFWNAIKKSVENQ